MQASRLDESFVRGVQGAKYAVHRCLVLFQPTLLQLLCRCSELFRVILGTGNNETLETRSHRMQCVALRCRAVPPRGRGLINLDGRCCYTQCCTCCMTPDGVVNLPTSKRRASLDVRLESKKSEQFVAGRQDLLALANGQSVLPACRDRRAVPLTTGVVGNPL